VIEDQCALNHAEINTLRLAFEKYKSALLLQGQIIKIIRTNLIVQA